MSARQYFQSELKSPTLILRVVKPVGSLADSDVMNELDLVLDELKQSHCQNAIIDFCETPYFGSSMLEALRLIWNKVHAANGKMILCRVSAIGREILEVAKFDHIWPITSDQAAAMKLLNGEQSS